jgi:response regulator NasT
MPTRSREKPGKLRILMVEDDTLVGLGQQVVIERLGHEVIGRARTADEALEMYRADLPDLVLLDIRLDDSDGLIVAEAMLNEHRRPIIIISAYSDPQLLERAGRAGVFGYLIKPISEPALAAQIRVAMDRFNERQKLVEEKDELARTLESRKLVERAKGILMKRLSLDEPAAHRKLQLESQKRRLSINDLARKIIESEELLGG